jgi:hypothetical protein
MVLMEIVQYVNDAVQYFNTAVDFARQIPKDQLFVALEVF